MSLPPNIDYTDKDFDALKVRLFKLITSVFPDWSDQNVSNFGNILVELFAFVGDVVTFYQDNQALESRIVTATQRKSLLALCKLIGYVPSGASAATVDVTFSIPNAVAGDVVFPAGTIVRTADVTTPEQFQLLAMVTIPAGLTSAMSTVENSENATDSFTSSGLVDQEFVLTATPFIDGSASVVATDGAYIRVDNFLASGPTDKHFVVVTDQNDRARVRFGDGTQGSIPVGTINIGYKTGGGSDGNVEPNAISQVVGNFTDSFGTAVQVSVANALKAAGGFPRMSNALIKKQAPASVRAPVNSVAREDFVINTLRLPAIARALMLTSNEDAGVPENTGYLFVIPQGGGFASSGLKTQVLTQVTVNYPCTLTFVVEVRDPLYKTVDIQATVFKQPGFDGPTVKASVIAALKAWFAITNTDGTPNLNVDFGGNMVNVNGAVDPTLAWSDIFNVVRDAVGVRKVDAGLSGFLLNGARADLTLNTKEFPQLGVVTVIDGDTSLPL